MREFIQIVFSIAALIFVLLPVANNVMSQVDPENYTVESKLTAGKTGSLEEVVPLGATALDVLSDKSIHEGIEAALSASAPCYDQVILFNAALQRTAIAQGAALSGFSVYPTFFGSKYYHDDENEIIGFITYQRDSSVGKEMEKQKLMKVVNAIASNNPDIRVCVDLVYTSRMTEYNSSFGLVSNPINHDFIRANTVDVLSDEVLVIDDYPESQDDYVTGWISTEHHWTPLRALTSYNKVASVMDWMEYDDPDTVAVVDGWYGSYARMGLDMSFTSQMVDFVVPGAESIQWKNYVTNSAMLPKNTMDEKGEPLFMDGSYMVYDRYYGSSYCEAINEEADNERICLVVCNSMIRPIKEAVASNYYQTIFVDPSNYLVAQTFQGLVDKYAPDDVVIFGLEGRTIAQKSPNFLSVAKPANE